jgi:hypothetical protein
VEELDPELLVEVAFWDAMLLTDPVGAGPTTPVDAISATVYA